MAGSILKNNYFELNSNVRHQILGKAIESKFASPYACIFMDYIEREFLKSEQIQPQIRFRYIYDIFFICRSSEKELDKLLNKVNSFHPNLTHERTRKTLNVLDAIAKIHQSQFIIDLYCKSTDGYQQLHFNLCHANYTKTSVVNSQDLKMKRICFKRSEVTV